MHGASAQALGITLEIATARSESDLETGFAKLAEARAGALVVDSDVYFFNQRDRIVALAARHGMPALYSNRGFADAGGLASYGGSSSEAAVGLVAMLAKSSEAQSPQTSQSSSRSSSNLCSI